MGSGKYLKLYSTFSKDLKMPSKREIPYRLHGTLFFSSLPTSGRLTVSPQIYFSCIISSIKSGMVKFLREGGQEICHFPNTTKSSPVSSTSNLLNVAANSTQTQFSFPIYKIDHSRGSKV